MFDDIAQDDVCFAFFPCTRFEDQINLAFRGEQFQSKKYDDKKKLELCIKLHEERSMLYKKICQLAIVCIEKGIRIVIENPYSTQHYLKQYWCLKPKVIDKDRIADGDYYKKPTQYWFINFEPKNNFLFEPIEYVETRRIEYEVTKEQSRQVRRSMIHPQYADRFIRRYIL